jgi:ABC-2 type transport system permease protein
MAVYKRYYKPYEGAYTPIPWRFLVIPKFAISRLFESRALLSFYLGSFIPALLAAAFIYFVNSPTAQALVGFTDNTFLKVNAFFFERYLIVQGFFCFLFTAWVGPGLISVDFANDALPLYLSRPFTRTDYLLGKLAVIGGLLSTITWVPGLLLFLFQASMAGPKWMWDNLYIAGAILVGSLVWVLVLSMLVLAISAWIRWKIAATAVMVGIFFLIPGFGEAFNEILRTNWGKLLNIGYLVGRVLNDLFRMPPPVRTSNLARLQDLPVWAAWLVLAGLILLSLWLLNHKLKPREVVR